MRHTLPPLILLTVTTTLRGLEVSLGRLESCGRNGASHIDHALCDPDHLVSPEDSHNINELLKRCGDESGHVKVMVFLAANITLHDNVQATITNPTTTVTTGVIQHSGDGRGGDGDRAKDIDLLREQVVASNNLTTTSSSVILLVAIREPFQMVTWRSDPELHGEPMNTTMEEALQQANTSMDQQYFTSTVVHVAYYLCQSVPVSSSRSQRYIILTVVWIAFLVAFIALLVTVAVVLIKVRYQALAKARAEAELERAQSQRRPAPRASGIQDFTMVSFKSTGHVLLGSTDITAVPAAQDCSSTDNLLVD